MQLFAPMFLLLLVNVFASDIEPAGTIFISDNTLASDREPLGSTTSMFMDRTNDAVIYSNSVSGSNWTLKVNYPQPIPLPYTYKDPDSGTVFYVESDGRHVSAIGPDGKILWSRDPFADAHVPFYRTETPRIFYIGKAHKKDELDLATKGIARIIAITYDSSQYGFLDVRTGDFIFWGQR